MIRVVNLHKDRYTLYIGRPSPWGNPWTHKASTLARFSVKTPQDAVNNFEKWLNGIDFTDVLQDQRQWILSHLGDLMNHTLGCHCKPYVCHGDILKKLAEEKYEKK